MPRMSDAEKRKSHQRILDAAAAMLRERGVDATSVGDVMKAASMTHGGFYRHFTSKEDMVAAALSHAAEGVLGPVEARATDAPEDVAETYVGDYLSTAHRDQRGAGCPLAAIAGEALRADGPVRATAEDAARRTLRLLAGGKDKPSDTDTPDEAAIAALSVLLGSIVLARLFEEEAESQRVLEVGRQSVRTLRTAMG